ncbi:MAG TPA: acyltransferase family protein [Bryobacteraceae bacterium]|nr:acyltransferase family protein [Bryobacteraceae bacterium]
MPSTSKNNRLQYLDWLRGVAALIMLQGHAFHSFLKPELRNDGPYVFSQFLGGMPPAIFLFLTGITLAFLMDSRERQGLPGWRRVWSAVRRSGYLLGIAFLFRLQLWLFAWPNSPWTDLFRVDILNCMGFAITLLATMALFRTAERVRLCAVLGLAIAAASPLASQFDWSGVHPVVKSYLAPDYNFFGFFPWAAYLAFGMSFGSLLRVLKAEQLDRAMLWIGLLGGVLIMTAQYFANLPYSLYPKSEYWLNSPAQVLTKQGVILLALPFAYLWTRYGASQGWSWIRQFGTTSLLVYWVHIELVYGRWLWFMKSNLNVAQTVVAAAALILLMLLLSVVKTYRNQWPAILAGWRWYFVTPPDRVSGD